METINYPELETVEEVEVCEWCNGEGKIAQTRLSHDTDTHTDYLEETGKMITCPNCNLVEVEEELLD